MRRHRVLLVAAMLLVGLGVGLFTHRPDSRLRALDTPAPDRLCEEIVFRDARYVACTVDLGRHVLTLALDGTDGQPLGSFERVSVDLAGKGRTLRLAMNGGMYHEDLKPVGLAVSGGRERSPLQLGDGAGNFFLKPNGVFYIEDERARILTSEGYRTAAPKPSLATQSGPMLLIDGAPHPAFRGDSTSRYTRNGLCAASDGRAVILAISRDEITFLDFALFWRDRMGCRDALYLDGDISSLSVPGEGIEIEHGRLGPILAVTDRDGPTLP